MADQITLGGDDAVIYEAIATLEFVGHQATATDIATAVNRDEQVVRAALASLTERGMLVSTDDRDGEPVYEPAWRGWSTAPEQSAGPQLS